LTSRTDLQKRPFPLHRLPVDRLPSLRSFDAGMRSHSLPPLVSCMANSLLLSVPLLPCSSSRCPVVTVSPFLFFFAGRVPGAPPRDFPPWDVFGHRIATAPLQDPAVSRGIGTPRSTFLLWEPPCSPFSPRGRCERAAVIAIFSLFRRLFFKSASLSFCPCSSGGFHFSSFYWPSTSLREKDGNLDTWFFFSPPVTRLFFLDCAEDSTTFFTPGLWAAPFPTMTRNITLRGGQNGHVSIQDFPFVTLVWAV